MKPLKWLLVIFIGMISFTSFGETANDTENQTVVVSQLDIVDLQLQPVTVLETFSLEPTKTQVIDIGFTLNEIGLISDNKIVQVEKPSYQLYSFMRSYHLINSRTSADISKPIPIHEANKSRKARDGLLSF